MSRLPPAQQQNPSVPVLQHPAPQVCPFPSLTPFHLPDHTGETGQHSHFGDQSQPQPSQAPASQAFTPERQNQGEMREPEGENIPMNEPEVQIKVKVEVYIHGNSESHS